MVRVKYLLLIPLLVLVFDGCGGGEAASPPPPSPPSPGVTPAWVNALAIGQWYEIPNSAMRNADLPNPPGGAQNKVNAWNSFVADPRTSKVYSAAAGGHGDYGGNEVDMLDVEREVPVWTELLARSNVPTGNVNYYPDGTPTSRHIYYSITFDEFNNRVMLFGGARFGDGFFTHKMDSYNLTTNSYSPAGTHPDLPTVLQGTKAVVLDPNTGNAYFLQDLVLGRWNRSSNTVQTLSPSGSGAGGGEAASAFDTSRNRILFAGGFFDDHHIYTLPTNAWTSITFSGANAANVRGSQMGMFYVAALDRFLVRRAGSGGTVYQINPSTFEATTFPTTGGASIPATMNGPYNKFLYLPRLGGAVYVPTYDGNVWFLRLH